MFGTLSSALKRMVDASTWSAEKTKENYVKATEELAAMQKQYDDNVATTKANLIKTRNEIDTLVNEMEMPR